MQQDPSAETTEDTGISINCSHPNLARTAFIHWYRQFPGRGPAFLVSALQGSKELLDPPGRLSVAADRRSNVLWLARPRRRDAAVYYCAQQARREEPWPRPSKNRRGRGRACVSGARDSGGRVREAALQAPLVPLSGLSASSQRCLLRVSAPGRSKGPRSGRVRQGREGSRMLPKRLGSLGRSRSILANMASTVFSVKACQQCLRNALQGAQIPIQPVPGSFSSCRGC